MKQKLTAGGELEILTQGEFEDSLTAALSGFSRPPLIQRDIASFTLDSSGNSHIQGTTPNVPVPVHRVKPGYDLSVHRVIVEADGYTTAVPFTNTAGGISLYRNNNFVDGLNLGTALTGLPFVFSYGGDAPILSGNDQLQILITGGPASVAITVTIQGTLETTSPDLVTS